ncbi:MAG TPA: S41 family peptidase [Pyrinomonadaceae bacterium]|jgi:C-terminal processing protease CtpA/Prc
MSQILKNLSLLIVLITILANFVSAQRTGIDEKFRAETINSLLRLLKDKYVYPEIALKMEQEINAKLKRGEYDSISDGVKLAEKITTDLRMVFDDKHLKISYSADPISVNSRKAGAPSAAEIEQARRRQTRENFGATKVEILKGNVGLIKLNYFAPLDWFADAYTAAMNYVANTDALIIDVRENRGSMDINAIPFFCSFLFDEPVQLGDIFWRETNETRQLWTYAQVPGKKYLDKPVYILTSNKTASGAEGFVRHLKRLKRAVLVGETTMGATMPGMSHRVNEHFSVWISTGRSSNGSAANENKGTPPNIAVALEKSLNAAYLQAVNQILQTAADEDWKVQLKSIKTEIEGKN